MTEHRYRIIWPVSGRLVIGLLMVVIGLGRLGVFTVGSITLVPAPVYGLAFLSLGIAMLVTRHRWARTWYGRLIACLSAGLLAGLALDVGPLNTSAAMLYVLALCAALDAGDVHGC